MPLDDLAVEDKETPIWELLLGELLRGIRTDDRVAVFRERKVRSKHSECGKSCAFNGCERRKF
jgi:hypothetical protein